MADYIDDFNTCARTFATFTLYVRQPLLAEITAALGVEPSWTTDLGARNPRKPWGWNLSSEKHVVSRDLRRHLDWMLDQIEPGRDRLDLALRNAPATRSVYAYWEAASDHGGPLITPVQMTRMGALGAQLSLELRAKTS